MMWMVGLGFALAAIGIAVLWGKLYLIKKSLREIRTDFKARVSSQMDTNTLLVIPSRDREMRAFAAEMNVQLRALRQERQKLHHGDRELKEAITNISHDLRTPVTAISGYLDLLEPLAVENEDAARYLSVIRERTEVLTDLTEELFRYSIVTSTSESLKQDSVNVNRVLEESLAAFYAVFVERGIVPEVEMPERAVVRSLDESALCRIFSNILHNALKYSDGDLVVRLLENGEVLFRNHAKKLDAVQVERLFDRFYTVEAARSTTGLGLSIAKTLTEKMGGTISASFSDQQLYIRIVM